MSDDMMEFEKHTNLQEFQDFVMSLMSPASVATHRDMLATAGLGLGGEGGEFADLVKKVLYHGLDFDDNVRQKFIKELGDIMFYVAFAARTVCGVGLQEVIDENVAKLSARYPSGHFSREDFLKKEAARSG